MPIEIGSCANSVNQVSAYKENARTQGALCISILNHDNGKVGSLCLQTAKDAENKNIIESLTRWRKLFMRYFMTQFSATEERTEHWLKHVILPSTDRLFFLIYDEHDELVGHIGLCNISANTAEIDNIIRGSKSGDPHLMYHAEMCLLRWAFFDLGVSRVFLRVFSNNILAMSLHKEVGFRESKRVALYQTTTGDCTSYTEESRDGTLVSVSCVYMEVEKHDLPLN